MNKTAGLSVSFLAASIAPGVVVFLFILVASAAQELLQWQEIWQFLLVAAIAWLVSAIHVVVIGIPFIYLLHKFNRLHGWTICLAGFVGGMIPSGIATWPLWRDLSGVTASHGSGGEMITTVADGVVTLAGWLSYLKGMTMMGALGAIAALAFWLVWYRIGKPRQPRRLAIPPMLVPSGADSKSP